MSSTKNGSSRQYPVGITQALSGLNYDFKLNLRLFLQLFFVNWGVYFALKLIFVVWNHKVLTGISFIDYIRLFIQGQRFDLMIVFPISVLLYLILQIPWQKVAAFLFFIVLAAHGFFICANLVDTELVNFVGRRFTKNTWYLIGEGNVSNLLVYLPMTFLTFLTLAVFFLLHHLIWKKYLKALSKKIRFENLQNENLKNQDRKNTEWKTRLTKWGLLIVLLVLSVIFARGGLQEKPLSFVDAKVIDHSFAHHAVLNSTFTFLKSLGQKKFERPQFFDEKEMLSLLNLNEEKNLPIQPVQKNLFKNKNLVIFILESFSAEYINSDNTPFLLSLADDGAYFQKAYANSRRSVEGIASILSGIPALMDEPFVNSSFASNDFVSLGKLLKKENYHTSFFHGAQNGSMRFDLFTKAAGYDHYYGLNEFPDRTQHDGAWGIWDEAFFNWGCQKMTEFPQPFSSVVFSLTSHQPYPVPEKYKDAFKGGSHPILKSIQYTDYSLKKFFECAKTKPWYKDTLFVFVADHTGPLLDFSPDFKKLYEIFMLFYSPEKKLNAKMLDVNTLGMKSRALTDQYAQQIDILPTLVDWMGLPLSEQNHLARSLLRPGPKSVILYADGRYEAVGDSDMTGDLYQKRLKAAQQYYSQGLYEGKLYYPQLEKQKPEGN